MIVLLKISSTGLWGITPKVCYFQLLYFARSLRITFSEKSPSFTFRLLSQIFQPSLSHEPCFCYGKRDICKACYTFELGSNGKEQKDIKRNEAVIPKFVRKSLCKPPRKFFPYLSGIFV